MVVILEVDAIEGVAFHYVDNFTMLILVFLSNCDVNKCSTNVLLTVRIPIDNSYTILLYSYLAN